MASSTGGTPFSNKIFFCDIVGYSRLDSLGQQHCIATLQAALLGSLAKLGCEIEREVIALPTGDGMILNFLHPDPAIHLRTALLAMAALNESGPCPFELRIGLNSYVDSWVIDINGKKNVVGIGINIAQRVMDLGKHGQILMHDDVRGQLASYAEYRDRISYRGEFQVKHGVRVPIAQYVDSDNPHIDSRHVEPVRQAASGSFDLDSILQSRIKENVLSIELDHRAKANLPWILDFIVDLLGKHHVLTQRRVAISWIVSELVSNVFEHSRVMDDDRMSLTIDLTASGTLISLKQPHGPPFDAAKSGQTEDGILTFFGMMRQQGFAVHARAQSGGGLDIGVEMSRSFDAIEGSAPEVSPDAISGQPAPSAQGFSELAYGHAGLHWSSERRGTILVLHPDGRVDETSWEAFRLHLLAAITEATGTGCAILLDMSGMAYMSSRGLRCLMLAKRESEAAGVKISVCGLTGIMREIFAISKYDRIFEVHDGNSNTVLE